MSLNKHAIEDLKWWLGVITNTKNNINTLQVDFEINTNASETGWRATDGSENENTYHINYLELLAIKHAAIIYEDIWKGCKHNRTKSDNTTAKAYINKMARILSDSCNHLSKIICYVMYK